MLLFSKGFSSEPTDSWFRVEPPLGDLVDQSAEDWNWPLSRQKWNILKTAGSQKEDAQTKNPKARR